MTVANLVPLIFCIVGLAIYLATPEPSKQSTVGKIMFGCGLLAICLRPVL